VLGEPLRASMHPTSVSPVAGRPNEDDALTAALLLVDQLHAHLPIGLVVYDAETLELVHANPTLLGLADPEPTLDEVVGSRHEEHEPKFRASELASALVDVAATGTPRHLPEFRHGFLGRRPRWWSANLHRIDTDRWGRVVITLAVDLTDQIHARQLLEEREGRRLALQQTIAFVSGQDLMSSLQRVVDALVAAFPIDAAALRLLDADAKLHLIAATGLRPTEIRHLAFEPITASRLETISEDGRHPLGGSLGLRWVEMRWLGVRGERIGALTVGARRDRRLSDDDLALFDAAAAQLGAGLEWIERSPGFLRSRSLELARSTVEEDKAGIAGADDLRPRELAILRLYAEGLETHQIAELLVLSVHTVRTHVKNARRRLGVRSRREALDRLKATDVDPMI
jgi:DNA-binding CsgD family transcriptional regulator